MAEYLNHPTRRYADGSPQLVLAERGQFIETETLTFEQATRMRKARRFYSRLGQLPLSLWPKHLGGKTPRFSFASSGSKDK